MTTIYVAKDHASTIYSIEAALKCAQPGDTIVLGAGIYNEQLVINKQVAIVGNADEVTIDGSLTITADVTLQQLTLTNSLGDEESCVIRIEAGETIIKNCRIQHNAGDGIFMTNSATLRAEQLHITHVRDGLMCEKGAQLYLHDSCIAFNQRNGVVLKESTGQIARCEFHHNEYPAVYIEISSALTMYDTAVYDNASHGISVAASTIVCQNCTIKNNREINIYILEKSEGQLLDCEVQHAGEKGYGVYIHDSVVVVERCHIHEHFCPQIFTLTSVVTVRDSRIYNGPEANGIRSQDKSSIHLERCEFFGHQFVQVLIEEGSELTAKHCRIYGSEDVGIELVQSRATITHCQLYENRWQVSALDQSNVTVQHCELYNVAAESNGCYAANESVLTVMDCELYGHREVQLSIDNAELYVARCQLHHSDCNGIRITNKAKAVIEHCELYENVLLQICIEPETDVTIRHCHIYNAPEKGIQIEQANVLIEHCTMHGNSIAQIYICESSCVTVNDCHLYAPRPDTVGIYVATDCTVYINDCIIQDHQLDQVFVDESRLTLSRTAIFNGQRKGVIVVSNATAHINDCEFYGHEDAQVVTALHSTTIIQRCDVHSSQNCGIVFDEAKGAIEHCHIRQNSEGQIYIHNQSDVYMLQTEVTNPLKETYGILVMDRSNVEIEECTITNHTLPQLFIRDLSTFLISKTAITDSVDAPGLIVLNAKGVILESEFARNANYPQLIVEQAAHVTLDGCRIHTGGIGLLIDDAYVNMENSHLFQCTFTELNIINKATANIRHSSIHSGTLHGVCIEGEAAPVFSHVTIYGHTGEHAQVVIKQRANPLFKHCKVYSGQGDGFLIYEQGYGTIEDTVIYSHAKYNVYVAEQSEPILRRNHILQAACGLHIEQSSPHIEGCTLEEHTYVDIYADAQSEPILVGNIYATLAKEETSRLALFEDIFGFNPFELAPDELQARLITENRKWLPRLNSPNEKMRERAEQAVACIDELQKQMME